MLDHAFVGINQAQYFKCLKNKLNDDEFLVVFDFAENYAFVVQQAVSEFHWNNNQATMYLVVIYFSENGSIIQKSGVNIRCLQHDAIAVHVLNKVVSEFIKSICEHAK